MTFKKTLVCVAGMLMLLVPVAARAEGDSPPGRWWQIPALAEKLDLSAQERQSLESLFTERRKVLFAMRSEVEKQRFELENILEARNLDQRAAFDQFRKLDEKRQKMALERFKYLLEVRKVLGSDRYIKLMNMAKDYRGGRGQGRGDDLYPR
jgi:Spy/CpxP family protein refolding chaperone